MSDDLVKRLRSEHEDCAYSPPIPTIYSEAADRIEALEKALALSAPLYSRRQIEADRDAWKANAERLAEALREAREWNWISLDEYLGEAGEDEVRAMLPNTMRAKDTIDAAFAAHTKQKDGTR